jgi:methylated-DNA-[protein]-cysteine S-methyltransferase
MITEARLERDLRAQFDVSASAERMDRLLAAFAERAAREDLLDVAYASADSPIGRLILAATPAGVLRVGFESEGQSQILAELTRRVSPRVLRAPAPLEEARRQLSGYFEGTRQQFELPLDWRLSAGFRRRVLAATSQVTYGETQTYREVATAAGSPNAVRAAGSALACNPLPIIIPCHRVVRSDGALGGYRGGRDAKQVLLAHEQAHRQGP